MTDITYEEFKIKFKGEVDEVGYLTILTNLAWELTIARHEIKIIKKTLEFANAK